MPSPDQEVKVSVIIPVFNAQDCIARAIQSVQDQTLQDVEVIVIDDCSTDLTVETVNSMIASDSRIRLLRMQNNGGPSAARNKGILHAHGQWIALLDADDVYKEQRLEKLINTAETHGLDMIADNVILYDHHAGKDSGHIVCNSRPGLLAIDLKFYLTEEPLLGKLKRLALKDNTIYCKARLKYVMLRDFITSNEISYPEHLRTSEDSYFYTLCLIHGAKAGLIPESYYVYTQPYGMLSGKSSGFSRTKPRSKSEIFYMNELFDMFNKKLSKEEYHLMIENCKRNVAFWKYKCISEEFGANGASALVHVLRARDPYILRYYLGAVSNRIIRAPLRIAKILRASSI